MTAVRIYMDGERAGPLFRRGIQRQGELIRAAVRGMANDAADDIERRGREDIAQAGNFGNRWTEGFHADVTEGGGNIRIAVSEDVPYWRVFQEGALILGKPLLWIPIATDAQGISAKDYPGALFRVDRKSDALPLLLSAEDKQVKYFGKESVQEKKLFHLIEIAQDTARKLRDYFTARMKAG